MASIGEVEAILITAFLAAVVAVAGIITQRVITRRSHTLDYLSQVDNDRDIIAARKIFIKVTADDCDSLQYAKSDKYDTVEAESLRLVLNEHERMAIALQFGVLDRTFVTRHCRGLLIRDWQLAAPFIYRLRAETRSNLIYHEFEDMIAHLEGTRPTPRSYRWRLWF